MIRYILILIVILIYYITNIISETFIKKNKKKKYIIDEEIINEEIIDEENNAKLLKKYNKYKNNKYLYFIPKGGINDIFSVLNNLIKYCKNNNRILLLDMNNSHYNINFSDFFIIKNIDCKIIYDFYKIRDILSYANKNNLTVYPNNLDFKLIDLLNKKINIKTKYIKRFNSHIYKNIRFNLPNNKNEFILFYLNNNGGNGFLFFKNLFLTDNIKKLCKKKMALLKPNYLCIHIRNTDYKSNFQKLYKDNMKYIDSFKQIYICTDDKLVLDYFKFDLRLNVYSFTTFPNRNRYHNLHYSKDISPTTKMQDLIIDIFMATNSKNILSNSRGGFTRLLKNCFNNKKIILDKLKS